MLSLASVEVILGAPAGAFGGEDYDEKWLNDNLADHDGPLVFRLRIRADIGQTHPSDYNSIAAALPPPGCVLPATPSNPPAPAAAPRRWRSTTTNCGASRERSRNFRQIRLAGNTGLLPVTSYEFLQGLLQLHSIPSA